MRCVKQSIVILLLFVGLSHFCYQEPSLTVTVASSTTSTTTTLSSSSSMTNTSITMLTTTTFSTSTTVIILSSTSTQTTKTTSTTLSTITSLTSTSSTKTSTTQTSLTTSITTLTSQTTTTYTSPNIGNVYPTLWKDDSSGAFSFTFDDGFRSQHTYVRPILAAYAFKGSFYVTTQLLSDTLPGWGQYGAWLHFVDLANDGHEIGSHTLNHPFLTGLAEGNNTSPGTLRYEIYQSVQQINARITSQQCLTFCYPYSDHNTLVESVTSEYFESARSELFGPPFPEEWTASSPDPVRWYTLKSRAPRFSTPRNALSDDDDELIQFINWTQIAADTRTWAMMMSHQVVPFANLAATGGWETQTTEWFDAFCIWLKVKSDAKELWVDTVMNVTRYIRERDTLNSNMISNTGTVIQIDLTDSLDDSIYNFPITMDIVLPPDWLSVRVQQGAYDQILASTMNGPERQIRCDLIPDGGTVVLTKQ